MNIYLHELKTYRYHTLMWIITICGIGMLLLGFFPILERDMKSFVEMIDHLPPVMKAIIGLAVESFVTPLGYYGFVVTYTSLLAAIQAANLGVGILSKEERERTADFLMTKTVSRTGIVTSKLLAVGTILVATNLLYSAVTIPFIGEMTEGSLDYGKLVLINLSLFILQLMFFSIGLIVSFMMKKIKSVMPISLGLVFVFYAISAFAVTSKEDKLRYITPFQYFKSEDILRTGSYEVGFTLLGVLIILVCIAVSYVIYKRKSIPAL